MSFLLSTVLLEIRGLWWQIFMLAWGFYGVGCLFCSAFTGLGATDYDHFMDSIYSVKIRRTGEDKIWLRHTKSVVFEVKSYYALFISLEVYL